MNAETRRPRLTRALTIAGWILAGIVLILVFVLQQDRIIRGNDRYDRLFDAYSELTTDCALADDCTTDAPTPAEVVEGAPGPAGADGPVGPSGTSVVAVRCSAGGIWLVTYSTGRVESAGDCTGSQGSPGADGEDGATITGPTGQTGPAGPAGSDGDDGADGSPPTSWTFTDALGFTYTCGRTDPFDADAPTYTCTT